MYKIQGNWTKDKMKQCIRKYVPEHGSYDRESDSCKYNGAGNTRCAVAALATPNNFKLLSKHEGAGINSSMWNASRLNFNSFPLAKDGMISLQSLHDRSCESMHADCSVSVPDILCDWIDANVEE